MGKGQKKAQYEMRVAIVQDERPLSSVWRIWSYGNDLYVTARGLGGSVKCSLHQSGRYRYAFVNREQSARFQPPEADRAFMKWNRPQPQVEGAMLLYQIIVPESGLRSHLAVESLPAGLVRLPRPQKGHVCFVSIMQVLPGVNKTVVRFGDFRADVLQQWSMPSGHTTWITAHTEPMTDDNRRRVSGFIQALRERAKSLDLKNQPYGELRAVGYMDAHDGIGRILDMNAEFLRRSPAPE